MNKKFYVTPEMEELEMKLQGMIAASGSNPDEPADPDEPGYEYDPDGF